MKVNKTKEVLLETATKLFSENGYEDTGIRDILKACGVSTGSFYHFFSSKESIFEAVIERYLQGYTDRIGCILKDEDKTFPERIDLFFEELKNTSDGYFHKLQGYHMHESMQLLLHEKTLLRIHPFLRDALDAGIRDGSIRCRIDADAATLASILIHGVEGILSGINLSAAKNKDMKKAEKTIRNYINLLLEINDYPLERKPKES